ncbi:hypothetical protein SISNIDRAFT_489020 [Sistotremastrum niveocremeum HHB9708]|uniref:Uncharacterized protein n=1 Tax=Sistotremastrum niveocremeum HHB9708 TaxID=1314777 RepID=A0A164QE02_9AGAM|nr:hypothetical protein SISNIDRAFT_489020 [Sistotremastrum niveocremeum HHB9708]
MIDLGQGTDIVALLIAGRAESLPGAREASEQYTDGYEIWSPMSESDSEISVPRALEVSETGTIIS